MKRIAVMGLGLIGILSFGQNKVSTTIERVVGTVNNNYALVRTDIRRRSPEEPPNVQRSVQGNAIGPLRRDSGSIDVELKIPMLDANLKTYGAPQLVNKIGSLVGAVSTNPKGQMAGVGISAAGVIAQYATDVAQQEMNELYGTQSYEFTVLEIIPTRYYEVREDTGKITVTDAFLEDFPKYQKQLQRYKIAFQLFRNINRVYSQWVQQYNAIYPTLARTNPAESDRQARLINDYYTTTVVPALKVKNREERALSDIYPPYRIAIMASPMDPGKTCGVSGKGPWEFTIVYYAGAQQTNKIAVKYCVPNTERTQWIQVSLVHNAISILEGMNQRFVPGGIKLVAALSDPSKPANINFARQVGYGAKETEIFNWFTSVITSAEGGDISQFLVPFDIYELKKAYAADEKAKKDAKFNAVLASMDQVILQAEKAKREIKTAEEKAKMMSERGEYGTGSRSYENQFSSSFGKGEPSGEIPIEPEIAEDEEASIKEFEAKGKVLEDLGGMSPDAPPAYPGKEASGEETPPPPYPGAATTAPKPGSIAYPWRDVAKAQAERDDLARDILTLNSVPGVDIPLPSSLQEKWSPTNKTGVGDITRYTEYFRALQAKDISMLDSFLKGLNLGYKATPVETTIWADKNLVKQERDMLAADIQTIKNMDRIPEQMSWKWNPDRLETLNDKIRYREYTKALLAKNIAGLDSLLRDKGVI